MRKLIQKIRDYRDRKFLERIERANAYKERNREKSNFDLMIIPGMERDKQGRYSIGMDDLSAYAHSKQHIQNVNAE